MSLHPSLLPVKKIKSNQARSTFSPDAIEQAAKAILDAEGTINPLVVRQLSFQEFEVIDGHLEYYAAVRAKELDLVRGEMIDAIVIPPEKESAILEQVRLLRADKEVEVVPSTVTSDSTMLEQRLSNLEKQIENQLSDLNRRLLDLNQQSSQRNSQAQIAEVIHTTISTVFREQLPAIVQQILQEVGTRRKKTVIAVPVEELEEKVKSEGYDALTVSQLIDLAKGRGLRGYSSHRSPKASLITFIKGEMS